MKCGPGNYLHHYLHAHWDFAPLFSALCFVLSLPQSAFVRLHSWISCKKWKPHIAHTCELFLCACTLLKFQPTVHACAHECKLKLPLQSLMNAEKVIIQSQEHIFNNNNNWVFATMPTKYNFIPLHDWLYIYLCDDGTMVASLIRSYSQLLCYVAVPAAAKNNKNKKYHKFSFKPNSMHYLVDIGHMRTVNFIRHTRTSHTHTHMQSMFWTVCK